MKETAVEWLINKIAEDYPEIPRAYREEYQKAKAMEKEQIIDAYVFDKHPHTNWATNQAEQYYKENYEREQ